MQLFYLAIPDTFYSTFTLLVAYLRRQQNFISDEQSQCPLICDTRWLNMIKVTTWFDQHQFTVDEVRVPRGKEAKLHAGQFVVDSDAFRP
jgi:hypothetical protein